MVIHECYIFELRIGMNVHDHRSVLALLKDGAYYCYCAYALRTSRYSGFLSVMLTDTEIFLRGLKMSGETGSY